VTESERLYQVLKSIQEPQGFFFNYDLALTLSIIDMLLANRSRYGYMACPCRLASGVREQDRDIICPCAYRADDVVEYGCCYCNLYVSAAWNEGKISHVFVPERRPVEKIIM
jgi:ferredoxin-thioredoxin reductase catalytic chain